MKRVFKKHEINYGCYDQDQFNQLWPKTRSVTIKQILESPNIPIKDKRWFVWNNCNLSLNEKKELALKLSWIVLPIYEEKYPNDLRVRECLQAIEDFKLGKISIDILKEKRTAAYAAADAAAAYAAASAAAYAAASAAADAAAAAAAAYAKKQTYSQQIQQTLIYFVK
jgi:hypothetical protein